MAPRDRRWAVVESHHVLPVFSRTLSLDQLTALDTLETTLRHACTEVIFDLRSSIGLECPRGVVRARKEATPCATWIGVRFSEIDVRLGTRVRAPRRRRRGERAPIRTCVRLGGFFEQTSSCELGSGCRTRTCVAGFRDRCPATGRPRNGPVDPEGFEPSPRRLRAECAAVTPRIRPSVRRQELGPRSHGSKARHTALELRRLRRFRDQG